MADLAVSVGPLRLRNPLLSASGTFGHGLEMQHFAPPEGCTQVINLADNDTKDWRAARREMRRAALAQSERGLTVETAWPPSSARPSGAR